MIGFNIQWYDAFFLLMLAISAIFVCINWERYQHCSHPLQFWVLVDYATIFVFRILMIINNGLVYGPWRQNGRLERALRLKGRIIVLVCLAFFLYPFLWAWTVIGNVWFSNTSHCVPGGQRWGIVFWLFFSYIGLVWILCFVIRKWSLRRRAIQRSLQDSVISEWQVLLDMILVPDRLFEIMDIVQETRVGLEAATYHPGLFLTQVQRDAVEGLIQQLPKFHLKAVPTECSECPICLEEFHAGDEVRGLPCAHNFHVSCIDEWLRLNIKCPRCRCSVFPNLDLTALGGGNNQRSHGVASIYFGGDATAQASAMTSRNPSISRYVQTSIGYSNLIHPQETLETLRMENVRSNVMDVEENDGTSDANQQI